MRHNESLQGMWRSSFFNISINLIELAKKDVLVHALNHILIKNHRHLSLQNL